jgi:hypothetical protein
MCKTDLAASYLMKLAELKDHLGAIGDEVKDNELVWIDLNGFSLSWNNFFWVICGREKLANFE